MNPRTLFCVLLLSGLLAASGSGDNCSAETRTWDGKHDISNIEVTVVYYVPSDRRPLSDWKERVDYFCKRIEQFHSREFQGQSEMKTVVHPAPLVSESMTTKLRKGDADAIFFRTLKEVDEKLKFATDGRKVYPILLVLSDINWQPLDDFYRLKPVDGSFVFEGQNIGGQHFPGATGGGARATYLDDRGVGWGLVSGDGWRVPYRGSDCVVYHEGCGHTVGLPHPEPIDSSVMGVAQYEGWISESFLNKEQKIRLGWEPKVTNETAQMKLFTTFRAIPEPVAPKPGDAVTLKLDWPEQSQVQSLRVRFQTSIDGPWIDVVQSFTIDDAPKSATLGTFERETPVSYRIDATLKSGATAELWGYLQVRRESDSPPEPLSLSPDLIVPQAAVVMDSNAILKTESEASLQVDLLKLADPAKCWTQGRWSTSDGKLLSPKEFGARLELPYSPPREYRMTLIVEPLDEPNGLLIGNRSGNEHRFVTLFSYAQGESHQSAIENVDGDNVGNDTTLQRTVFRKNQLSQVIVTVRSKRVTMSVDGRTIVDWSGTPDQLSLSDYWKTPDDTRLFIGAYDCRYRFHRISLEPLSK